MDISALGTIVPGREGDDSSQRVSEDARHLRGRRGL